MPNTVTKNFGLIERDPKRGDSVFGAVVLPSLCPERNWLPWKPIKEYQNHGFETYACVSFSAWNCIETLFNHQYGRLLNKSDRFTATLSGTKDLHGNYMNAVADCIKNNWSVQETDYPFGGLTYEDYYQCLPKNLIPLAKQEQGPYRMNWHWVDWGGASSDLLWDALQYSPVQVTVLAWETPKDGIYQRSKFKVTNHAVTVLAGVHGITWTIFDHYDAIIKTLSWDFYFGSAIGFSLSK